MSAELGLSPAATADLAAVFFWTYLAMMIPTGLFTDVIGARRVAVLGCVVSAAGSFLFRIGDSIVELTLARVLIAAGSPAAFVGRMRFVALTFPERRATFSGRGILLGNVGAVCSGAPLALLLGVVVWRDIWLGVGILSLILAAAPSAGNPRGADPRRWDAARDRTTPRHAAMCSEGSGAHLTLTSWECLGSADLDRSGDITWNRSTTITRPYKHTRPTADRASP